jgi:hypothetical protein
MVRRVIAVVGILALVVTLLPRMPGFASEAADCCNGIMCPMHKAENHAANCDDMKGSGAVKSCPVQAAVHYTATIVFVLLAPAALDHEIVSEPAMGLLPSLYSNTEFRVDSPPPRLPLSA